MTTIGEVAQRLEEARLNYDRAKITADAANKYLTQATNALNDVQRSFDLVVAEQKKNPPWNTHWHNSKGEAA
jgi:hypothetical protein